MNSTFYEDIMNLMNEGKSSEDIASLMVEALNKAQEERNAKLNAEAIKAKKVAHIKRVADLVNEYFETFEPGLLDGFEITEEDCADVLANLEEMVKLVKNVKTITVSEPQVKFMKGDAGVDTMHNMFDDVWKEISDIKDKITFNPKASVELRGNGGKPNPEFKPPVHKPQTDDEIIKDFLDKILK